MSQDEILALVQQMGDLAAEAVATESIVDSDTAPTTEYRTTNLRRRQWERSGDHASSLDECERHVAEPDPMFGLKHYTANDDEGDDASAWWHAPRVVLIWTVVIFAAASVGVATGLLARAMMKSTIPRSRSSVAQLFMDSK